MAHFKTDTISVTVASAVADALTTDEVAAGRLSSRGVGASQPLPPQIDPQGEDDPAARQLNRRVETILASQ